MARKKREPTYNWIRRINIELNKVYKTEGFNELEERDQLMIKFANEYNRCKLKLQFAMLHKSGVGYPARSKGRLGIFRPLEALIREKLGDIKSQINLNLEEAEKVYEDITLIEKVDAYVTEEMLEIAKEMKPEINAPDCE